MEKLQRQTFLSVALQILKTITAIAAVVGSYVVFDQWWANKTRLEVYPNDISVDSLRVIGSLFTLDNADIDIVYDANSLDKDGCFDQPMAFLQASALVNSGQSYLLRQYNLNVFDIAIALLSNAQTKDSFFIRSHLSGTTLKRDSIQSMLERRDVLIRKLQSIRDKKSYEFRRQVQIVIRTKVANLSNSQIAILDPCLLKMVDGPRLEIPLRLYGYSTQMQLMGMEMKGGPPIATIEGRSTADVSFATPSSADLGHDWESLESSLRGSQFKARILFYTADGTLIESEPFPFSMNFANLSNEERLKKLKAASGQPL